MEKPVCHDLKTERTGVAPPLPPVLAIVPLLFYVGIVACAVLCAKFYFAIRASQDEEAKWEHAKKREVETTGRINLQMNATQKEKERAAETLAWLEGSRSLQPINMVIARSVSENSSIQELSLSRKQDDPGQLKIELVLTGETQKQMVGTLLALAEFSYRPYFEERKQTDDVLYYEATLIRN